MSLNSEQERAVRTVYKRVLVLAGAGSGKTGVITHRIAHLVKNLEVPPGQILGLTFTNKAASEMRHRVEGLIGSALARQVTLSTFHSFCMQVLRREIHHLGYTREFSLYDERDLKRLIDQMAREMLGHEGELPSLGPTYAALSKANQQVEEEEIQNPSWHEKFAGELHDRLQTTMRAYNAVSFDSLISLTIQLFEKNASVLERYQDRYRFLMIDEYQDTNPAQLRLAELLAQKYHNLCVVGDDDQSIYGWRGAEVKNILNFKADSTIKLEQNYRSTQNILDAANAVIRHNENRHEKNLWSADKNSEPIEIFNAATDAEEATSVIARLIRLRETQGLKWKEMAILYRSNALSRQFELALMQASWQKDGAYLRGIPYEIFGGLEFSERSEIKDLLAYLRLIANPLDTEALLRIINVPRRGISDTLLDAATQLSRSNNTPLWELLEDVADGKQLIGQPKAHKSVATFIEMIKNARTRFAKQPLAESLTALLEELNYKKAIEEEVKSDKMRQFKWENVLECVNALAEYENTTPPEDRSLQHFVSTTMLARQPLFESNKTHSEDKVQLMTLHSAKGLEFKACFIVGLEDHILPHEKSLLETGIEEERRLFYVGITRARKYLTLSMARSRLKMGKYSPTNPSRFLFEIPKELLKVTNAKI